MKITTRLSVLIGVAIMALVLASLIAYFQLRSVNQVLVNVTQRELPSLEAINHFQTDYQSFRALIFQHISEPDAEKKTRIDQQITNMRQDIGQRLEAYEKTLTHPEMKTQFAEFREMFLTYMLICDTSLARSRQGQGEAAMELVSSPFIEDAASLAFDALNKLTEITRQQVKAAETNAGVAYHDAVAWMAGLMALISIGFIAFGMFFGRSITHPLFSMRDTLTDIGQNLDLTRRLPQVSRDEIGVTVEAFNAMADKLQNSLGEIATGADGVSASSDEMTRSAAQLSQSVGRQSDATSVMAAAVEEMTVSINHIADRADEAQSLAQKSGESAQQGSKVIADTLNEIQRIAVAVNEAAQDIIQMREHSQRISDVVRVIREIAEQTNLLALNAAIEAARAGEQGRGFAVVADEVRKLAERTAGSTQEIAGIIETTQQGAQTAVGRMETAVARVGDGVRQAEAAGVTINAIVGAAEKTGTIVYEITSAIREQNSATQSIAQEVEKIAQMTESTSQTSSNAADLARRLHGLSASMRETIARYRF